MLRGKDELEIGVRSRQGDSGENVPFRRRCTIGGPRLDAKYGAE